MTPEEINIEIAEHCGWTGIEPCTCHEARYRGWTPEYQAHKKHIPHFHGDLNAMAEAEKSLHGLAYHKAVTDEEIAYLDSLALVMGCTWHQSAVLIRATAAQRAESFLRTVGKWKEVQS